MESFQQDALRFGCLRGFKHMSLRPRGKEELLVTVHHRDDALGPWMTAPRPRQRDFSVDDDEPESPRAKSKRRVDSTAPWFIHSCFAQTPNSTPGPSIRAVDDETEFILNCARALRYPPASTFPSLPSFIALITDHIRREAKMADDENEPVSPRARPRGTEVQAEDLTTSPSRPKSATADASTFLIGAYAKYDRPYVWLREGGRIRSDGTGADDLPLDLNTLRVNARSGEPAGFSARVWDLAEELVGMNVFPTPPNAFAVDHGAIKRMEAGERFLAAGAMVGFLHDILEAGARRGVSGRDGKARGEVFVALVEEDIDKLVAAHLAEVPQALLDRIRP